MNNKATIKTYILDSDRNVVEVSDDQWWPWFSNIDNRHVDYTVVGRASVSTDFVGFGRTLFETLINDEHGRSTELRCDTWQQAVTQHREAVEELKKGEY